jgi:hypothetical protein
MPHESVQMLYDTRLMRDHEEVRRFEQALASHARHRSAEDLVDLFLVFDDECQTHEVMFGLVHYLESFGLESFLRAFFDVLPKLSVHAKEWVETIHFRLLNHASGYPLYAEMIKSASVESREIAIAQLKTIANEERPPISDKARALLNKIAE